MSALADAMMGRSVRETMVTGDVPPMNAGGVGFPNYRPLLKRRAKQDDEDERKARRQRMTATAIVSGLHEDFDVDGSLFPEDAEEVAKFGSESDPVGTGCKVNVDKNDDGEDSFGGEPLLPPSVALVAPDATPDAYVPLDPVLVPEAEKGLPPEQAVAPAGTQQSANPALDTVLGRPPQAPPQQAPPQPFPTSQQPQGDFPPVMSAESLNSIMPGSTASRLFESQPDSQMPDHKAGDGRAVMDALRRFRR